MFPIASGEKKKPKIIVWVNDRTNSCLQCVIINPYHWYYQTDAWVYFCIDRSTLAFSFGLASYTLLWPASTSIWQISFGDTLFSCLKLSVSDPRNLRALSAGSHLFLRCLNCDLVLGHKQNEKAMRYYEKCSPLFLMTVTHLSPSGPIGFWAKKINTGCLVGYLDLSSI